MKRIRYISTLILILLINAGYSQSLTAQAYKAYQAYKAASQSDDLQTAMVLIDSAVTTNERFDSQTWQLRGVVYREFTTENEMYYREIALESFVRAQNIDADGVYESQIRGYIRGIVIRYYNDAVNLLLEDGDYESSERKYMDYKKKYAALVDPNYDFNPSDIDFYGAFGSAFLDLLETVNQDERDFVSKKALYYCNKVLEIDSVDYLSNFNSGIVYYNMGANLIVNQDPFIGLEELILSQKKSEEFFLAGLPYLHRAERIKPDSKEVWVALMGCYYGLNNNELYLKYQTLVDEAEIDDILRMHEKNPKDVEIIKQLVRIYSMTLVDKEKEEYYKKLLNELR